MSRQEILDRYGRVEDFLDSPGRPLGCFTDDTEMTLAFATSLVEQGALDAAHCASTYVRFYLAPPRRGYGPSVSRVLELLRSGADHRLTGRAIHPEGSFANGGAMRIAPAGLAFRRAPDGVLREAVRAAVSCTHAHPEAIEGASIQARAVAILATTDAASSFDPGEFLAHLLAEAATNAMRHVLEVVRQALAERWSEEEMLGKVCTSNEFGRCFQIRAIEAVACALWTFLRWHDDPEECLICSVALGGDTDTVGALTGALVGARHGTAWIPKRWYDNLENHPGIGRDFLVQTAISLARLDLREVAS